MGILGDHVLKIPMEYQEPVALAFGCALTLYLTNVVLDIAYLRYRWRQVMLAAKFAGLIGALFYAVWPSQLAIYGLCISVLNGFGDPRLHFPSVRRNPCSPVKKWVFMLTQLAHHAGSAFLIADLLKPIVMDPTGTRSPFDLDVPIMGAALFEVGGWLLDTKVLMRTASRWFDMAHNVFTFGQISCMVTMYLFFDCGVPACTLLTSVIGSFGWLVSSLTGFRASTWEEASETTTASVARTHYRKNLLTVDPSVLQAFTGKTKKVEEV
jgi:hypothetical protein